MNNLFKRIVTALFLAALLINGVLLGKYSFIPLMLSINLLGLWEFYRLFGSSMPGRLKIPGICYSACMLVTSSAIAAGISDWSILLLNIPLAFIIFLVELFAKSSNPFQELALCFMGIFYITIPSVLFIFISFLPFGESQYNPEIILGYFFIVWASDSGAYAFGKLFGKHPLFKRISPGKTWEGSVGGAISALLTAGIVSLFFADLSTTDWLITGCIIIVFGTFGDLIKSMLKRSLNVKDSGRILPGHGGILDRFDAMLGAAPFVFIYLSVLK